MKTDFSIQRINLLLRKDRDLLFSGRVRAFVRHCLWGVGHPRSPLLFPIILHFMGYEIPYPYIICIGIIGDFYRFL